MIDSFKSPNRTEALVTEIGRRLSKDAFITFDRAGISVDLLWFKLQVPVQHGAMAKLGSTKPRYEDWISEDAIRLSDVIKDVCLSGFRAYQNLRIEATWSTKKDRFG